MSASDVPKDQEEERERPTLLNRIRTYVRITGINEIARRYFVMNAFDGALTILGIIMGAYAIGAIDPKVIIGAGLGGSLAMAISGVSGAYMTESAERLRELERLEKAMLKTLDNTVQSRAIRFASIYVAVVDGAAPLAVSTIAIVPFILSQIGLFEVGIAVILSVGVNLLILFLLGGFLGRISKRNVIISGLKMAAAGIGTALVALLLNLL
ncbi:MAG: VIT1/CCC1 transporter family protein [Promethearchaeota archaeon]